MKKIISSLGIISVLAVSSFGDFARVEIGGGVWQQKPKGYISRADGDGALNLNGRYTSDEKTSDEVYIWALVKHPIPVVPNLRAEYVSVSDEGKTTGSVNGANIPGYAPTTLKTTQVDIVPYYNILDNTFWITLDVGLDIKLTQTKADVGAVGSFSGYSETVNATIPLGYVRARVQIPTTGLGIESDVKYVTYGGNTVYDARAKVDYTFDIFPVIQPGIEVGYRVLQLKVDDGSTQVDLKYSGVYGGLMLRF